MYADLDYLNTRSEEENKKFVTVVSDPTMAFGDAHAVAICTEWDEFKTYNWEKIYNMMLKPAFIFDGRALFSSSKLKEIGFEVYKIGKGT